MADHGTYLPSIASPSPSLDRRTSVVDRRHVHVRLWSLRSLVLWGSVVNLVLAVVIGVGLVGLRVALRQASRSERAAAEELQLDNAIRVGLLEYSRKSALADFTGSSGALAARDRAEIELLGRLAEARSQLSTPGDLELLAAAEARVDDYLAARREADRQRQRPGQILVGTTPILQRALDAVRRVALDERAVLADEQRHVARWIETGNAIAIAVALLLVLAALAVTVGMNRLVFMPLVALTRAIEDLAGGARRVRLAPGGSAEFRGTIRDFNDMAERLEREHSNLLTFLAGVAHDLRNPLSALRLAVEYLQPNGPLPSEEKIRSAMAIVGRQVTQMERMVGDFLDASRIESGHLELRLERCDVRDVVREVGELYGAASFLHPLVVDLPRTPLWVRGDEERLAQVVNNLVSNAIKYSPSGGEVRLSAAVEPSGVVICVTDHGMGIGPDDLEHVFEPFRRTGASRESVPGVGLGLSVSRTIVEAHGGHIEVRSQLGVGTTFLVHLPSAEKTAIETAIAPAVH